MVGCAAYNCTGKGKSLFSFPNDPVLRRQWVRSIKRLYFKPSATSKLCQSHFKLDCFERNPELMDMTGIRFKLKLKADAIPTEFDFSSPKMKCQAKGNNIFMESKFKMRLEPRLSPQKKVSIAGGAFAKRARHEVIRNILVEQCSTPEPDPVVDELAEPLTKEVGCDPVLEFTKSMETQTPILFGKSAYSQTDKPPILHMATQLGGQLHSKYTQTETAKLDQGTQVVPDTKFMIDASVSCNIKATDTPAQCLNYIVPPPSPSKSIESHDSIDYEPPESCSSTESESENDTSAHFQRKFFVFESCLLQLFTICSACFGHFTDISTSIIGSMVKVKAVCTEGHVRIWCSQPWLGDMPMGNFVIAANTLLSGCQPAKLFLFLHNMQSPCFTERTYHIIQKLYLIPSILEHWKYVQDQLLDGCSNIGTLGGDARMDSPGFSAKYGTYSLMDLQSNKIISVHTLQSNEVGGSNQMELAGLKRAVTEIEERGITFKALVTDRHIGVKKYIREMQPDKTHYFDVFHVAKSIGKKVEKIGKKKKSCEVNEWVHSIKNHVYWCASTSNGNEELVKEKWLSLFNHLINQHTGHGELYTECAHGPIERNWLEKGSAGYKELKDMLTKSYLMKDIVKLSPSEQTSNLESYHNVILHFAPKHTHFHFQAMTSRVLLAAIHFNENSQKVQLETKKGVKRWRISYLKYKKSGVVKAIKSKSTYGYVKEIMERALDRRRRLGTHANAKENDGMQIAQPQPLTAAHQKVAKALLVSQHQARFAPRGAAAAAAGITEPPKEQQRLRPRKRKVIAGTTRARGGKSRK